MTGEGGQERAGAGTKRSASRTRCGRSSPCSHHCCTQGVQDTCRRRTCGRPSSCRPRRRGTGSPQGWTRAQWSCPPSTWTQRTCTWTQQWPAQRNEDAAGVSTKQCCQAELSVQCLGLYHAVPRQLTHAHTRTRMHTHAHTRTHMRTHKGPACTRSGTTEAPKQPHLSKLQIWGLVSASTVQKCDGAPCPVKVPEMHFWVANAQPCL